MNQSNNIWQERYRELLSDEVIFQRCYLPGVELSLLGDLDVEVACSRLEVSLKSIFIPTKRCIEIMRTEIGRALAHAELIYSKPNAAVTAVYNGVTITDPYTPTIITGPAGTGKTLLRLAFKRLLDQEYQTHIDESHRDHIIKNYAEITVGGHKSAVQLLRALASPEIAEKKTVRISEPSLIADCARWQRWLGTCLIGVDEMQFMAQSTQATTLITRTLLSIAGVGIPWFVIANYSMCNKLLARSPEATQRLLGRPSLLLPDGPKSADWIKLLEEYALILNQNIEFELLNYAHQLWNLCAGLKRELVKLIICAYKICRRFGRSKISWSDMMDAYLSVEFYASRNDIELLIAHAAQGGKLPRDLACPFAGKDLKNQLDEFSSHLQAARQEALARSVINSAMNAEEKVAVDALCGIKDIEKNGETNVIPLKKKRQRSLDSLKNSGKRRLEELVSKPKKN